MLLLHVTTHMSSEEIFLIFATRVENKQVYVEITSPKVDSNLHFQSISSPGKISVFMLEGFVCIFDILLLVCPGVRYYQNMITRIVRLK